MTLDAKRQILERLEKGAKPSLLMQEFNCGKAIISDIKRSKAQILAYVSTMETSSGAKKRRTMKKEGYEDVEKTTYLWFLQERSRGTPISGPIITEKALQFYRRLHGEASASDFKASQGWLDRFKRRHGIRQLRVVGEKLSADVQSIQPFIEKLYRLIQENSLQLEQLYNADETGLYWRVLPTTTLASAREKEAPGVKSSKDRVTLLGCVNATGQHKLQPVLIGKYKKPRCFKNVNMSALPVHYTAQKNAWMNSDIFETWFHQQFVPAVKRHLQHKSLPCKAVLLIDNCAAHPDEDMLCSYDGQIRTVFLPPNTTSVIQPLDGGILETVKRN